MLNFEFATAARIVFGAGALRGIGEIAAGLGRRALIVTGSRPHRADRLADLLSAAGIDSARFAVSGEPKIDDARSGMTAALDFGADMIIGFGGGSAIDAGKAIAALVANGGDPLDYLEVIGKNQPLTKPAIPFIAIPTTAGTGSEVTRNAVLASPEHQVKVSMRSPSMLAKVALVDPELTYDSPPSVTAASGIDALTQVIEPYVSNAANPITDGICREGIRRAASLQRAYQVGDAPSREDMALASLFGGLALANARLGAVHGIAGPLGGMFPVPHGVACGRMLPAAIRVNLRALSLRAPDHPAYARYAEIARLLTGVDDPAAAYRFVESLIEAIHLPRLREYGIAPSDFDSVAEKAERASSMKGNPIALTRAEIVEILESAW
jgi:alcohol dehydrogenase class IV